MRHFFLSLAIILFTLFPLSAQNSVSSAKGPLFPLYLGAVAGGGSTVEFRWRPDWPPAIPPDAFKTTFPAASLELPQDKKPPLVFALNQRGQVQRLLVPDGETGTFLPVAVTWNSYGLLETLTISQDSTAELWRIGTFSDDPAPIPLPGRFELRGGKDPTTVVFTYGPGRVTETWYDQSAVAVALYQYTVDDQFRLRDQLERDEQGQIVSETSYDYNSQNLISRIIGPDGTMTALYDSLGRPLELRRWIKNKKKVEGKTSASEGPEGKAMLPVSPQTTAQTTPQTTAQTTPQIATQTTSVVVLQAPSQASPPLVASRVAENPTEELYRYQWGDDGLLRRITGYSADGTPLDYRYDYTLDPQGSWVERKTTSMEEQFGALVPQWGPTVERKITYGGF